MEQRVAKSFRVFLVEDSELLRARLQQMVAALPGASVSGHAADAGGAIAAILADPPDAVVLDIQLAGSSGFDVLREVSKRAPQVAFYVLTNFANDAYRAAAERLGARGFFDKSNDIDRLRSTLAAAASPAR